MGQKGKIGFFRRLYVLKNGRLPLDEAKEESLAVRALRKQLKLVQEIMDDQSQMIADQNKIIKNHRETSVQEKMIDAVKEIFIKKPEPINITPQQTQTLNPETPIQRKLETGDYLPNDMTDEQIKNIINQYSPKTIKTALLMGDDFLKNKIREYYPNITEKSLNRGLEIARSV